MLNFGIKKLLAHFLQCFVVPFLFFFGGGGDRRWNIFLCDAQTEPSRPRQ